MYSGWRKGVGAVFGIVLILTLVSVIFTEEFFLLLTLFYVLAN